MEQIQDIYKIGKFIAILWITDIKEMEAAHNDRYHIYLLCLKLLSGIYSESKIDFYAHVNKTLPLFLCYFYDKTLGTRELI